MKFKRRTEGTKLEYLQDYLFADKNGRGVAMGYGDDEGKPAYYAGTNLKDEDVHGYCKIVVEYDAGEEPTP